MCQANDYFKKYMQYTHCERVSHDVICMGAFACEFRFNLISYSENSFQYFEFVRMTSYYIL